MSAAPPASASASAAPAASGSAAPKAGGGDANASPAALLFAKRCSSCHNIGDGDKVGPDLLGVLKRRDKAWIKKFVTNPSAAIDSGDPTANELLKKFNIRMPEQALSDDEFAGLFAYFEECTAKGGCKPASGKIKKASEATPAEIEQGRTLFDGTATFANGGASCISCHNVRGAGVLGGGTLGKDLTFVYSRLGDDGMANALASGPCPGMKDVYAKRALKPEEQFALKAYFWNVQRDGTQPTQDLNFFYLGIIGLGAALGGVGAIWAGRVRPVRENLSKRPAKVGKRGRP